MPDQSDRLSLCSGIEDLPPELYREICEQLEPRDIAKLRLVSKKSSEVATPCFLSCVHLIFTTESFKKLYDISQHPVISQHITSILYEADLLADQDRTGWEEWVFDSDYLNRIIPIRALGDQATDEDFQEILSFEDSKGSKHASYTKEQLDRAWHRYQAELEDQIVVRQRGCGTEMLRASIACLPKLKTFRMSLAEGLCDRSHYLVQALGAGLPDASGKHLELYPRVLPQLRAVLLNMQNAGIKLETFACGEVSWRFFQAPVKDWTAFAATLSRVRNFKIRMSTSDGGFQECREFMKSGRCADLLSQACNHLRKLEITLASWMEPTFGLRLIDLVADHVWLRLSKVALSGIETTEDILVHFLERHRATLRKLRLREICLTTGEWPHALPRMRSSVQLDYCLLERELCSNVPERTFQLGLSSLKHTGNAPVNTPYFKTERLKNERTIAINEWFRKGGICPLTDEWSQHGNPLG